MQLIDSHCHIDDDRYDGRREQIIANALAAGIRYIVVPATTANRWEKLQQKGMGLVHQACTSSPRNQQQLSKIDLEIHTQI